MAFASSTIFDVQNGGSDTANGGGFDPASANFATDLAATSATGTAPVCTSASYNFVAGDVGAWLYIKSGTNWTPGWYQIASVASNAATLTATIGSGYLLAGSAAGTFVPGGVTTVAGCATTASPTSGTWGIDYSQGTAPTFSYTDMVIGATTTQFTSVLKPVGPNLVGNCISVTSGTGFTVQVVQVSSVSGVTATCDKSLGTTASTGGNGGLGGSFATPGFASKQVNIASDNGCTVFLKYNASAYQASSTANAAAGRWSPGNGASLVGWNTTRTLNNTDASRPTIQPSANSVQIITTPGVGGTTFFVNLVIDGNTHTGCIGLGTSASMLVQRCKFLALAQGLVAGHLSTHVEDCEFNACTSFGLTASAAVVVLRSTAIACASGFDCQVSNCRLSYCTATGCTNPGFNLTSAVLDHCTAQGTTGGPGFNLGNGLNVLSNCLSYNNSTYGFAQGAARVDHRLINCAGGANTTANYSTTFWASQVQGFVTLSADPFTNKSASPPDLSLNATAGGGAACKAAGIATAPVGLAGTASPDIGSFQSGGTITTNTYIFGGEG